MRSLAPVPSRARSASPGRARDHAAPRPEPGASCRCPPVPPAKAANHPRRSRRAGADRSGRERRLAPEALARHRPRPPGADRTAAKSPRSTPAKAGGLPRRETDAAARCSPQTTRSKETRWSTTSSSAPARPDASSPTACPRTRTPRPSDRSGRGRHQEGDPRPPSLAQAVQERGSTGTTRQPRRPGSAAAASTGRVGRCSVAARRPTR